MLWSITYIIPNNTNFYKMFIKHLSLFIQKYVNIFFMVMMTWAFSNILENIIGAGFFSVIETNNLLICVERMNNRKCEKYTFIEKLFLNFFFFVLQLL